MCYNNCQICKRLVISDSVTVVAVDGVDTLVIDIPLAAYGNNCRYCIVVAQAIPDTATINMPVAISIGGVTTTVYPLTRCDCAQVTACAIRTRTKYPVIVSTNAIGGVFKVLKGLSCAPNNALPTLPVETPAAAVANGNEVVVANVVSQPVAYTPVSKRTRSTTNKNIETEA